MMMMMSRMTPPERYMVRHATRAAAPPVWAGLQALTTFCSLT